MDNSNYSINIYGSLVLTTKEDISITGIYTYSETPIINNLLFYSNNKVF